MFTGLVETVGSVVEVAPNGGVTRITVASEAISSRLRTGDSVAVNGVCLTALDLAPGGARFSADLAAETIARTTLSRLTPGALTNLELPTPSGSPLGGHVVQGHVDGTATLLAMDPVDSAAPRETTDWRLRLEIPEALTRYVVEKGSITVEGISLTVAGVHGREVTIAVIPHTYAATNLRTLAAGDQVNIEVDVLGKYAERRESQAESAFTLTTAYLLANGY